MAGMTTESPLYLVSAAGPAPSTLGESPLWHAAEQALYYVDIAERQVLRLDPATAELRRWAVDSEPGCIALIEGGGLAMAQRDGLWRLDLASGRRSLLSPPPYEPGRQRFNDGKPDAAGRFWIGSIDDARAPDAAPVHRYQQGVFTVSSAGTGITTSNGLAWSPDQARIATGRTPRRTRFTVLPLDAGRRACWASRLSCSARSCLLNRARPGQSLDSYGGRPDGAAVDAEGCYWVAMFEGQRLLRLSPEGQVLMEIKLPVRCPTMPTFGGADLRTLYLSTAREKRPAEELAAQPLAGCLLQLRVEVPGLLPHALKL